MRLPSPPTDKELEEVMDLEAQIRPLRDRLDELKMKCREAGSLCTENYVCTVSSQTSTRIASLEDVQAVLGLEVLETNDLIRVYTYKIVRVTEKSEILP